MHAALHSRNSVCDCFSMTCQMVFLSGYEFLEGSQCASSQDVATLNQTVVLSSRSIVNWQLTKKLVVKLPDSGYFCAHRRFEPALGNRKGLLRKARRSTNVLNNVQLEYSWPLL